MQQRPTDVQNLHVRCQAALISDLTTALDAPKEHGSTTYRHVSLIPGWGAKIATLTFVCLM